MALSDDERRALRTRLAPGGDAAADVVARAVEEDEELREVVVDGHGDIVAFTDRRALFVAVGAEDVQAVGYEDIEVRRRDHGLAIDALVEGGRLVLDVARGTFMRLAIVGTGAPPGRATGAGARSPPTEEPAAAPGGSPDPAGWRPRGPASPARPARGGRVAPSGVYCRPP